MRIKDISQALGLSPETIRHYERMGLLHPHREETSNYRSYDEKDVFDLIHIRCLYGLGLPLNHLAPSLANTPEDMLSIFACRQEAILQEMARLENKLKRTRFLMHCFSLLDAREGEPRFVKMGGMYRLFIFDPQVMAHPNTLSILRQWMENTPYTHCAVHICRKDLRTAAGPYYPVQCGIGMMQEYFEEMKGVMMEPIEYQPRHLSARLMLCVDDPTHIGPAQIKPLLDLIDRENLMIINDLYGWVMHIQHDSQGAKYYISLGIECG